LIDWLIDGGGGGSGGGDDDDDDGSDLDDLEVLNGLNGDVELDEALGSPRTQLLAVYTSRSTDNARLLVHAEPEVAVTHSLSTVRCTSFTRKKLSYR